MGKTKINWADYVWNPIVGCSKASAGCANCYAERMAVRLAANPKTPQYRGAVNNGRWSGRTVLVEKELRKPPHWKKPRRIFVCSMSDLFHPKTPGDRIAQVFAVMAEAYWHTFLVLTKRAARMAEWSAKTRNLVSPWPLNVWAGVSIEDQPTADDRIPRLLSTRAYMKFISYEPALGPVDLQRITLPAVAPPFNPVNVGTEIDALRGEKTTNLGLVYKVPRVNWVIAGGESGPGAWPAQMEWFQRLRDQCKAAGVPFWFKQEGGLHGGGCLLDGVEHKESP